MSNGIVVPFERPCIRAEMARLLQRLDAMDEPVAAAHLELAMEKLGLRHDRTRTAAVGKGSVARK